MILSLFTLCGNSLGLTVLLLMLAFYDDKHGDSYWLCGLPQATRGHRYFFSLLGPLFSPLRPLLLVSVLLSALSLNLDVLTKRQLDSDAPSVPSHTWCSGKSPAMSCTNPWHHLSFRPCLQVVTEYYLLPSETPGSLLPSHNHRSRGIFERQSSWNASQISAVVTWNQNSWLIQ